MPKKEKVKVKERPLPQPPGKKEKRLPGPSGREETGGLIFDKLQQAIAEGKAEEFMKENLPGGPEGEYARKLAGMMMEMSGVPFSGGQEGGYGGAAPEQKKGSEKKKNPEDKGGEGERPMTKVPQDVLQAAMAGNVSVLADLLKQEYGGLKKEYGGLEREHAEEQPGAAGQKEQPNNGSLLEKEVLDSLFEISVDNNLAMDWLVYRALKLYIKKYRETGQL